MSALPSLIEQATTLRNWVIQEIRAALPFVRDGKLDLASTNIVGSVPPEHGGSGTNTGAEPSLGNPSGDHFVLTSSAAGARQWVQLIAGAGISLDIDGTTGAITISATGNIQTLTFGGDDLTFGGELIKWGAV